MAKPESKFVVSAENRASKVLHEVAKDLDGLGSASKVAGSMLAGIGAGIAGAAAAAFSLRGISEEFKRITGLQDSFGKLAQQTGVSVQALTELDRVGLTDLADRRPHQLSGGQAQRVTIARALACRPDVLLLDEPLSALDVVGRGEVRDVLHRALDDFAGVAVIVTHDLTDALSLADTVVALEDGRLTQTATPDEMLAAPATAFVSAFTAAGRESGGR